MITLLKRFKAISLQIKYWRKGGILSLPKLILLRRCSRLVKSVHKGELCLFWKMNKNLSVHQLWKLSILNLQKALTSLGLPVCIQTTNSVFHSVSLTLLNKRKISENILYQWMMWSPSETPSSSKTEVALSTIEFTIHYTWLNHSDSLLWEMQEILDIFLRFFLSRIKRLK